MLLVFKSVIRDYDTPSGTTLSRNLTAYLSHQIDYLVTARPLSVSMGNAIRWLKREISIINIDTSDTVAKRELQSLIDTFIKEKIEASGQVIVQSAAQNINDGDVLLTFARSEVVKQTFVEAHSQGKQFRVIVVDSRPLHEGKKLVSELASEGIKCTYILINALSYVMSDVTTVFLGAHAMFANGLLYSRVGSALVATSAKSRNIPVLVLCESIKFSDRVQFDAVTLNELSSPDALLNISINSNSRNDTLSPALRDWRDVANLNILNVLYDLTPAEAIKKIVSEVGNLPPSSVPVILREYKSDYNA
ncbi:IF-2B-domain-containing protein [Nadsonia fulvescens var. elongata DSM 6958]|uniref:Translation initiation factor eIF2B subunit delta n=1 Tax=Nadsonia fulvescens var. elongata DSM 6958 TaxID=857566 RepID=A0A1E3PGH1_9ASCO|nr:IF-2B-domain-containing protein [Nadsonia fulvescens var. elongata DSM 6958]